jgi:MFS family permease
LLGAFLFSSLAEFGTWVSILVWAHEVRGATFVGVVAAIQLVFAAVTSPVFSLIGDRLSRARALSVAYFGMALSLAATGVALMDDWGIVVSLVLASIAASTFSVVRPIHASLIPDLSDEPADAVAANVVSSTMEGGGTFLGPALAGAILVISAPGMVFVVTAVGALMSAMLVSRIGSVPRAGALGGEIGGGVIAAFHMLRRLPAPRFVILLGGMSQLVAGSMDILTVVLAIEILGLGESGAGFVVSLLGLGGLVGGVLAASVVGRSVGPVLVVGAIVRGVALVALGAEPGWLVLLLVIGAGFSLVDIGVRTLLQRLVAPDAMSRAFGVLESVSLLGLAGGSLLASGLIAVSGASTAFVIFGSLLPLTVALGFRLLAVADREADIPSDVIAAFERVGLFSLLAPPSLESLARRSRIARYGTGSTVIVEGEMSRFVLLVVEGGLDVTKAGNLLATLGPGEIVGEIAALHDVPRTATVKATEPVLAISVPGDAFVQAVRGETAAWSMSTSVAGQRLAQQG